MLQNTAKSTDPRQQKCSGKNEKRKKMQNMRTVSARKTRKKRKIGKGGFVRDGFG